MRTGCCGWSGGPSLKDDAFPAEPGVEWFMDYRNADGSVAEMCGNGVRVYAHWLDRAGWLPDGGTLALGTRAGIRQVRLTADGVSVDMGPARVGPASTADVDGRAFAGTAVDVGNPHLACVTDVALDALDLTVEPGHDRTLFPHGVNVEFVSPVRDGRVAMRVHERGVGETRSCGTGTVAAVVAALRAAGRDDGRRRGRHAGRPPAGDGRRRHDGAARPGGARRLRRAGPRLVGRGDEAVALRMTGATLPSPPGVVPPKRSCDSDRNPRDAAGVVVEVCLPR